MKPPLAGIKIADFSRILAEKLSATARATSESNRANFISWANSTNCGCVTLPRRPENTVENLWPNASNMEASYILFR